MIRLFQTALAIQNFCDRNGWHSCLIGGVAVQRWAEPRVTRDVDITLLTGFGHEDPFIDRLLEAFPSRIADAKTCPEEPYSTAGDARRYRCRCVARGTPIRRGRCAPRHHFRVSRRYWPPHLLRRGSHGLQALCFSRAIDLRDAEGIAVRNRDHLDWSYIETHPAPLAELKEAPEIMQTLARIRAGTYTSW
jgi:hypothetical protein